MTGWRAGWRYALICGALSLAGCTLIYGERNSGHDLGSLAQDAASADATTADGAQGCAGLFCEDFEQGLAAWTVGGTIPAGGILAPDGVAPHQGQKSLHALMPPIMSSKLLVLSHTISASGPTFAVRAYVRVDQPLASFSSLISFEDPSGTTYSVTYQPASSCGGTPCWGVDNSQSNSRASSVSVSLGSWTCIELIVNRGSANTDVSLYVGPTLALSFTEANLANQAFTHLDVGWPRAGASMNQQEAFLDDLVFSSSPIGCP